MTVYMVVRQIKWGVKLNDGINSMGSLMLKTLKICTGRALFRPVQTLIIIFIFFNNS